jgi:hypothetical protein
MTQIVRSGIPKTINGTALAAPGSTQAATILVDTPTTWIDLRNKGASPIKLYWTQRAFLADEADVEIPAGDRFDGPYELYGNKGIWLKGDGGDSPFVLHFAQRVV